MAPQKMLRVDRLTKTYSTAAGPLTVLHEASFELEAGASIAVVGPSGSVVASEIHSELGALAQQDLADRANVTVYAGDGMEFDPGECDAILINPGVSHPLPLWLDRLRPGGRMLLPITTPMTSASAPPPSSNKHPLASSAECPIRCRGRLGLFSSILNNCLFFISIVERTV